NLRLRCVATGGAEFLPDEARLQTGTEKSLRHRHESRATHIQDPRRFRGVFQRPRRERRAHRHRVVAPDVARTSPGLSGAEQAVLALSLTTPSSCALAARSCSAGSFSEFRPCKLSLLVFRPHVPLDGLPSHPCMTPYDYAVIAFYFIYILAVSWFFRRFVSNVSDYFRGGGKALWW